MTPRHDQPGLGDDERGRHHADPGVSPYDWDARYASAEQMWSGNPNSSLAAYVTDLEPGSVLDVGWGEGSEAQPSSTCVPFDSFIRSRSLRFTQVQRAMTSAAANVSVLIASSIAPFAPRDQMPCSMSNNTSMPPR